MTNEKEDRIVINNEISLNNITTIKKKIDTKLKNEKDLVLELLDIDKIDLSGIQLLKSLEKTLKKKGKTCNYKISLTNEIIDLLLNTGFDDIVSKTEF